MMTIDTTNLCSHLQKKLFEPGGIYYPIWKDMQNDEEPVSYTHLTLPTNREV